VAVVPVAQWLLFQWLLWLLVCFVPVAQWLLFQWLVAVSLMLGRASVAPGGVDASVDMDDYQKRSPVENVLDSTETLAQLLVIGFTVNTQFVGK